MPSAVAALIDDIVGTLTDALAETVELIAIVAAALGICITVAQSAATRTQSTRRRPLRFRPAAAITVVVAFLAGISLVGAPPSPPAGEAERMCNGHVDLCHRPFDAVTFAATHNSMASPVDGFWFPSQDTSIDAQLDIGIRALLIDTHTWQPILDDDDLRPLHQTLPDNVGSHVAEALEPLHDTRSGSYLCHRYCALGAFELTAQLTQIATFLDDRPDEIVTVIIEDNISPAEPAPRSIPHSSPHGSTTIPPGPGGRRWRH